MLKEFREFIAKGNMLDLAVGIVIGAAFTAIITSLVKDIITPLIGFIGLPNFENLFLVVKGSAPGAKTPAEAVAAGATTLNYGAFLTAFINFVIVAFVLFAVVKASNKLKRQQEAASEAPAEPEIPNDEKLLVEIRDLLKAKG